MTDINSHMLMFTYCLRVKRNIWQFKHYLTTDWLTLQRCTEVSWCTNTHWPELLSPSLWIFHDTACCRIPTDFNNIFLCVCVCVCAPIGCCPFSHLNLVSLTPRWQSPAAFGCEFEDAAVREENVDELGLWAGSDYITSLLLRNPPEWEISEETLWPTLSRLHPQFHYTRTVCQPAAGRGGKERSRGEEESREGEEERGGEGRIGGDRRYERREQEEERRGCKKRMHQKEA